MAKFTIRLTNGVCIEFEDSSPVVLPTTVATPVTATTVATPVTATTVATPVTATTTSPSVATNGEFVVKQRRRRRRKAWLREGSRASTVCNYLAEKYPSVVSAHELSSNLSLTVKQVCDSICGILYRHNCVIRMGKGKYRWVPKNERR